MKKKINIHPGTLTLMIVAAILITVTSIYTKQKFYIVFPLYNSLIIMMVNSTLNKYGYIMGGLNSVIYAGVYVYQGLYGLALSAILVSFPIQLITFVLWNKKPYKNTTMLRKMSGRMRMLLAFGIAVAWVISVIVLYKVNPGIKAVLDASVSVLGYVLPFMSMFAFIETYPLNMVSGILCVSLYGIMTWDDVTHLPYLIFNIYSAILVGVSLVNSRRIYAEQQALKK